MKSNGSRKKKSRRLYLTLGIDREFEAMLQTILSHLRAHYGDVLTKSALTRRALTYYGRHVGALPKPPASSDMDDTFKVA